MIERTNKRTDGWKNKWTVGQTNGQRENTRPPLPLQRRRHAKHNSIKLNETIMLVLALKVDKYTAVK